jgi:hypothetical protein
LLKQEQRLLDPAATDRAGELLALQTEVENALNALAPLGQSD